MLATSVEGINPNDAAITETATREIQANIEITSLVLVLRFFLVHVPFFNVY